MTVHKSHAEAVKERTLDNAINRVVNTLVAQGVNPEKAAIYVENNVTFMFSPNRPDRVFATLGSLRSQGWSDEAMTHFARTVHLSHQGVLGGKPVPLGAEQFVSDMDRERAATVTTARTEGIAAVQEREHRERQIRERQVTSGADQRIRNGADPQGAF